MKNIKTLLATLLVASVFTVTGCAVYPVHDHGRSYGPPPHAPAHGYRYKYDAHDLVYDSNLGVYLVIGYPGYYFLDDSYYRYNNDGWYYSKQVDRNWQQYRQGRLPPGLAKKYQGNDWDRGHDKDRKDDKDHGRDRDHGYDRD